MQITDEEKKSMAARKKLTQDELRDLIGILIDAPAQGSGNTNSGNTSRIFFENLDIVARITGLDRECLERSKNILTVLSCPYPTNVEKVKQYSRETAERIYQLYGWYKLPPSVHIGLMHAHEILEYFDMPTGALSGEAFEATHKVVKDFRRRFTRKISRRTVNEDLFKRLLLNSDPLLSLSRSVREKKRSDLSDEVKNLLILDEDA
ncbi:hypothetical protein QAD02_003226 [Eretmocerus hayati]|uniref:Uncharacterized protein n=1 Tax=Eretmocerus hayati TaxID=131215 RepID=A0ACC2NP04_9HYME|nr:hypothetical protein QAD02_003226 [Eretmocerus hayati]